MKRKLKIVMALFLTLAVCLGVFGLGLGRPARSADSDPLADLIKQQEEIAKQIEARKKEIENSKNQLTQAGKELLALDLELEKAQASLLAAERQLVIAEALAAQISEQLDEVTALLEQRLELFKERLVVIYTAGEISVLDVLFQAESFRDFFVSYDMLKRVMQQDSKLLEQIKADMRLIEDKALELEKRIADSLAIKADIEKQSALLNSSRAEKAALVAKIENDIALAEKARQEEEELSKKIAEEIRLLQEDAAKNPFNGVMAWPVDGYTYVTSHYGPRTHPVTGALESFHTGVDLRAPQGTRLLAAEAGRVISINYNSAYGNYLVIDHGGGVSTFYAHLSAYSVKLNQQVKKGEVIGLAGATGLATGPHLHFEVRINGSPVDPQPYLKYPR
ncbi:MAG: peptidoglycan DD-metalloendopeptidase family protein [Clostridiales bacterium]|nr:peptidoglycan DD-metalloendopeptidase family protein [Clostridiales bacterium]